MSADSTTCYFEGNGFEIAAWKLRIREIAEVVEGLLACDLIYRTRSTIIPPNPDLIS
jgi:hypothetical protein